MNEEQKIKEPQFVHLGEKSPDTRCEYPEENNIESHVVFDVAHQRILVESGD